MSTIIVDRDMERCPWKKMLIAYLMAFGLSLFFLNAVYWDDWVLFGVDEKTLLVWTGEMGWIGNWVGHLNVAMLKIGPSLYRITTLVLGYCCGMLLWKLLRTIKELASEERFWITLLFIVSPFNPARYLLCTIQYTVCLFAFFLAWYLLVNRIGLIYRSLSLVLFLFSFNTNSLLVFYLLPIVHAAWLYSELKWKSVIRWGARNALFILAPIFYFWFKTRYFPPSETYTGYNVISLKLMAVALLPFPFMGLSFYWVGKRLTGGWRENRWFLFVFSGLFTLWLAAYPYLVTGKVPTFTDWNSRHQLLMPLGGALLLVGAGLFFGNLRRFCRTAAIVSVLFCIYFMAELALDWWKQKEVITLLAQSQEVKSAKTIVVVDKTNVYNAFGRTYRFYEFNAWLKKSFGDETRFAVNDFELESIASMRLPDNYRQYANASYKAGNYSWSKPDLLVTIRSAGVKSLIRGGGLFKIFTEKIGI